MNEGGNFTKPLNTPILFIAFRRPDTTRRVFEEIRIAKPKRLFIAANAPQTTNPEEIKKVEEVRRIIESVDWDCEVKRLFREKHLNAKTSISSAIDWFFENVDEGIILEDDALPHPTFFKFCEELLEYHRHDERIMVISGDNFQLGRKRTRYSYYFSRYAHIWGWASWRRAWRHYDVGLKLWPEIRDKGWLIDILSDKRAVTFWTNVFESAYRGDIDTWDYQWTFACWIQNGLSILPNANLMSNIGFGINSTHTKAISRLSNLPTEPVNWPLSHPPYVLRDAIADAFTEKEQFGSQQLHRRIIGKLKHIANDC
jgi:hypothetical protein